ncbi:hypothetical protein GIB67_025058 [Kingdonia uniflora]|uniref:Uncharacterized protein n=2 Tax=Magnoliopsida TaxID=3398 RepID=A0A7J7N837_9MAGN|nr:hypothetical protein GIB67_025058 [Kingdonia uniflora]
MSDDEIYKIFYLVIEYGGEWDESSKSGYGVRQYKGSSCFALAVSVNISFVELLGLIATRMDDKHGPDNNVLVRGGENVDNVDEEAARWIRDELMRQFENNEFENLTKDSFFDNVDAEEDYHSNHTSQDDDDVSTMDHIQDHKGFADNRDFVMASSNFGKNGALNRNANTIWVVKEIKNLIKDASTTKPIQISDIMYRRFEVRVSYYTVWNARNMVMEKIVGSYDKGYALCPELCVEIQKSNPGSIVTCSREDGNLKFTDMCISFKASLDGFSKGCRPIFGLDGCFLKGKYGGQCLNIISLDANNGFFPIAVFICRKKPSMGRGGAKAYRLDTEFMTPSTRGRGRWRAEEPSQSPQPLTPILTQLSQQSQQSQPSQSFQPSHSTGQHFRAPRQDPNARGEHGGYRATQTSRGLAHWFGASGQGKPSNRVTNKAAPAAYGVKMKQMPLLGIVCLTMLFVVYRTTNYQHQDTQVCRYLLLFFLFCSHQEPSKASLEVKNLPLGIIQARSDLELRPLWSSLKVDVPSHRNLLAISAGIKQKKNVNTIVQKFLTENFTVILFHYDCNVDGWRNLDWYDSAIHIVAHNQTKWWFAKRFLHPDVVSIYDYVFVWDEDLGVENFDPGRYLRIMKLERLEISQPALDPDLSEVHHRITVRQKTKKVHRRIYESRGSTKCSESSEGPPCTGWVEGMAPVFSRAAWRCTWHLIQNDLVHGWGLDMKLGYCAQGDRTKKVGIIDSEYIVHQGVQTLGGSSRKKVPKNTPDEDFMQRRGGAAVDVRSEIRKQSTSELQILRQRWDKAVREDKNWVDPFKRRHKTQ